MKVSAKTALFFLFSIAVAAHGPAQTKKTSRMEEFEFEGQEYSVTADFLPAGNSLILNGRTSKVLNDGLDGENVHLGTRVNRDNFYVFWLVYRDAAVRLAYYDFRRDESRVLPLDGFSFIGMPEIIETGSGVQGLLFLGDRAKNDDIYYYEPETGLLTQLTATPFSEKGFTLVQKDGRLEIQTRSLWTSYRYSFDPLQRECVLLEKEALPAGPKTNASTGTASCNTYIGFGDSITWGEMEGEQHLESCYLTQMKTLLTDPGYAHYYGTADPVNLGVPGETTHDGTERIDRELSENQGLYFLLMMGVNDVISINCSVSSSLENLGYIIDAAKAGGRRVIVSTLTPSKAVFSLYAYYWKNLQDLSAGILALAGEKKVASVDALAAFMNTDPPNGWRNLLENIIPNVSSGNHPNAAGNRIIAGLFAAALADFPPLPPSGIRVLNPQDHLRKTVQWDANFESDFSHFAVEFAFQPDPLSQRLTTSDNHFTFQLFPFLPKLYFRLQAVDRGDHASAFSTVLPAQTQNFPRTQQRWKKR
jgi:lysophospholipase L1-like esterase